MLVLLVCLLAAEEMRGGRPLGACASGGVQGTTEEG